MTGDERPDIYADGLREERCENCLYCGVTVLRTVHGVERTEYECGRRPDKPDQIVQPYMFGDPFEKKTCLWLKGLEPLKPTDEVEPEPRRVFKSGNSMPAWYADAWHLPPHERAKVRSRTFPGIAKAMANQWCEQIGMEGV